MQIFKCHSPIRNCSNPVLDEYAVCSECKELYNEQYPDHDILKGVE